MNANGRTIYYVPIEPLDERYTRQWYDNFPPAFLAAGFNVVVVNGEQMSDFVDVGTFLDINTTIVYKNSQMSKLAKLFKEKKIQNDDIIFVADTEFWGLESIRLMAQMNGVDIKLYSFCHAASYTKEDAIEVASPYQKYTELGWIAACDMVFVGSNYHREAIIDRRIVPLAAKEDVYDLQDKIVVTGNPIFEDCYRASASGKKNQIIISNRFDWEKRPNLSLDFAYVLKKKHPDWNIIVTTSRPKFKSNKQWLVDYARSLEQDGIITIYEGLTKTEYHKHLAESKVMLTNSIEENFGYCIVEALIYNTYPVAKNELSHPELLGYDDRLLFNDEDEIVGKIEALMQSDFDVSHHAEKYLHSLDLMIEHML